MEYDIPNRTGHPNIGTRPVGISIFSLTSFVIAKFELLPRFTCPKTSTRVLSSYRTARYYKFRTLDMSVRVSFFSVRVITHTTDPTEGTSRRLRMQHAAKRKPRSAKVDTLELTRVT